MRPSKLQTVLKISVKTLSLSCRTLANDISAHRCYSKTDPRYTTIETRHLKIFVTVYKTRSFTKAAEELYTSQPTISEHIHNLESRLNCKLFDRLGRSILPTAEAEVLYPRALSILDDLTQLVDDITATSQTISGELIIGASTIPGTYILPEIAASFRNDNPGISFEIRINDSARIVEAVAGNELLVGVVGAQSNNTKVQFQPIADDELIMVAAGDYPVATNLTLKELGKLPFIIRERGSGTRKNIETFLTEKNHPLTCLNICATLGSSAAVKEAVKANLGISALSRYAVKNDLERGSLKKLHIEGFTMKRSFYLVTSPKRTLPHHYLQFVTKILNAQEEVIGEI